MVFLHPARKVKTHPLSKSKELKNRLRMIDFPFVFLPWFTFFKHQGLTRVLGWKGGSLIAFVGGYLDIMLDYCKDKGDQAWL